MIDRGTKVKALLSYALEGWKAVKRPSHLPRPYSMRFPILGVLGLVSFGTTFLLSTTGIHCPHHHAKPVGLRGHLARSDIRWLPTPVSP